MPPELRNSEALFKFKGDVGASPFFLLSTQSYSIGFKLLDIINITSCKKSKETCSPPIKKISYIVWICLNRVKIFTCYFRKYSIFFMMLYFQIDYQKYNKALIKNKIIFP